MVQGGQPYRAFPFSKSSLDNAPAYFTVEIYGDKKVLLRPHLTAKHFLANLAKEVAVDYSAMVFQVVAIFCDEIAKFALIWREINAPVRLFQMPQIRGALCERF